MGTLMGSLNPWFIPQRIAWCSCFTNSCSCFTNSCSCFTWYPSKFSTARGGTIWTHFSPRIGPWARLYWNPWISSKIYPSQTMPFDQIWPDLGFLWIGGIIFQCFSKKPVPGFHFRQNSWISSKIYPSQTMHAFWPDLARLWIPMDRGYHISMFFKKSVPGFHFRQNPWISSKI